MRKNPQLFICVLFFEKWISLLSNVEQEQLFLQVLTFHCCHVSLSPIDLNKAGLFNCCDCTIVEKTCLFQSFCANVMLTIRLKCFTVILSPHQLVLWVTTLWWLNIMSLKEECYYDYKGIECMQWVFNGSSPFNATNYMKIPDSVISSGYTFHSAMTCNKLVS